MRGPRQLFGFFWLFSLAAGLAACSGEPVSGTDGGVDEDADGRDAGGGDDAGTECGGGTVPAFARLEAPHRARAECGALALTIESLADGVIRLRYAEAAAAAVVDRSFALVRPASELAGAALVAGSTASGALALCAGDLTIEIDDRCRARAIDGVGRVLIDDVETSATSIVRRTPADEPFFGLGEKTGALDRRGRRYTFWNTDAYDPTLGGFRADADPLYASIPFFVALREDVAYGVFTDVAHRLELDLAASDPERYRIETRGPAIDQYLIPGPAVRDVVRRYTALTGRTPLPPRWSLGHHQSRWGYASAARVIEIADQYRGRDIPADTLWLDIQHMRGYRSFTFDPATYGDPRALADALEARGFRLVVIEDPGLEADPGWDVYDRAIAEGLALRRADGSVFEGPAWPGTSIFLDYTLPAARAFWGDRVGELVALGIDGVWLDVNEPTLLPESGGAATLPDDLPIDGDGIATTMAEGHNVYALHEARATVDGLARAAPDRRPFVLTRAGSAGIQRHAAMWTGDAPSTWASLAQTPAMLASLGISGVPFVGSDVGGYSGRATPELYARWMQLGAFSPFCRAHVTNGVPDQEPWAFGTEVEDISRHRLRERYRWLPYLYSLFAEHEETGAPPFRPMVWEFQDEPATWRIGDQVMIGPWVMIAPVLAEGARTRRIVLPRGRWTELDSGAMVDGPAEIEVAVTLAAIPTFVREGAILVRGVAAAHTGIVPSDLRIDAYPAASETRWTMVEDAGDGYGPRARTEIAIARTERGSRVSIARSGAYEPPSRTLAIHVHGIDGEVTSVRDGDRAVPFEVDRNDRTVVIALADRASIELVIEHDVAIASLAPPVDVTFEVTVPAGTPTDRRIHVATSADGWSVHHPLEWVGARIARGTVRVPRGAWLEYKYTRGDWDTVEKWDGCVEATNRYGFGAAHPVRVDRVATWRDLCPP